MEENKVKRTWVYVEQPATFEMAGCSCGNENTQWSEYQQHLWCDKCQIDFIPKSNGIFDGFIPIETVKLLGLTFTRVDIETNEVSVLDDDNEYMKAHELKMIDNNTCVTVFLKEYKDQKTSVLHKANFYLNPHNLHIVLEDNENCPDNSYIIELALYNENIGLKKWQFNVTKHKTGIHFNKEEETSLFCKWLLTQKFAQVLPNKEEKERPKI